VTTVFLFWGCNAKYFYMGIDVLCFIKNYLNIIAEFISLVVAVIYYPHLKRSFMKWVLPFLAFIIIAELIASYFLFHNPRERTTVIYYIIGIIESIFYGYVFCHLKNIIFFKKVVFILCLISTLIYLFCFIFYINDYEPYIFALTVSGFFLVFISLTYMYHIFLEDHDGSILLDSGFWIAFGVSLFFSGISVVFYLHGYIVKHNLRLFGIRLYNIVPRILCILLYLSISAAIMLWKKQEKAIVLENG
jgi:hypothetical protein